MPLPIETPAPKASSLIKRFQQTIDSQDANQSLPLPDSSLKQSPFQSSDTRRSASAGTPQLIRSPQLGSINRSSWNPPAENLRHTAPSRPLTADPPAQQDQSVSNMLYDHPTPTLHHSPNPLIPVDRKDNHNPTLRNSVQSTLDLPLGPPIDQPSDLSRLEDLSKSDLAVQSPISSSKSIHPPLSSGQPKIKAPISAEAAQVPRARKVTNHITAPTAASLAKMRDSQVSRSNSQTSASNNTKAGSTRVSPKNHSTGRLPKSSSEQMVAKVVGSPKLAATNDSATGTATIQRARTSSNAPKERAKMQQVRPSTPATTNALRRSVIAKTKAPPLPTTTTDKAPSARTSSPPVKATATRRVVTADSLKTKKADPRSQSVGNTASSTKPDQRPLQRARVASVATPIPGIRKSPNLKATAQASDKLPAFAKPTVASVKRTPDVKTTNPKNRSVVTQPSRSTKSSKQGTVAFPEAPSTRKSDKSTVNSQEANPVTPTSKELVPKDTNQHGVKAQLIGEPELQIHFPKDKENALLNFDETTEDEDRVVRSQQEEESQNQAVEEKQEDQLTRSEASDEDAIEIKQIDEAKCFQGGDDEVNGHKRVVGLIDSIVIETTPVAQRVEATQTHQLDGKVLEKHSNHISLSGLSLNSDDDHSKVDFDASTTTNTDFEE